MKIFNIGITELIVILIIALIVLGPDGIVKTARTLGKTIRKVIRSPIWAMMIDTQRELRDMPTKLVREAGIEEDLAEIRKTQKELQKTTREIQRPAPIQSIPRPAIPTIQPPSPTPDIPEQAPPEDISRPEKQPSPNEQVGEDSADHREPPTAESETELK